MACIECKCCEENAKVRIIADKNGIRFFCECCGNEVYAESEGHEHETPALIISG